MRTPFGISIAQREIIAMPKSLLHGRFKNIVSYTEMPRGGHFFALEEPELLSADVIKFVKIVEDQNQRTQGSKTEL